MFSVAGVSVFTGWYDGTSREMLPEVLLHCNQPLCCALYHAVIYTDAGYRDEIAITGFCLSPHPAQALIQVEKKTDFHYAWQYWLGSCSISHLIAARGDLYPPQVQQRSFCFWGFVLHLNSFSDLKSRYGTLCCLAKKKKVIRHCCNYLSAPLACFLHVYCLKCAIFCWFGFCGFCGEIHHMWL